MSLRRRLEYDLKYCATGDPRYLAPSEATRILYGLFRLSAAQASHEKEAPENLFSANLSLNSVKSSCLKVTLQDADGDPLSLTQSKLAQMRAYGSEGKWAEVVAVGASLFHEEVSGVWMLSAHQMMANAYFELGSLEKCLTQVNLSKGLQELYPHSPVVGYLRVLEVKTLHFLNSPVEAKMIRNEYFNSISTWTPNDLLTALRLMTMIDLGDSLDTRLLSLRVASYLLAKRMGDDLYAGLALAELALAYPSNFPSSKKSELNRMRSEFSRIDLYLNAVDRGASERCFSAELVSLSSSLLDPTRCLEGRYEWILLEDLGLFLNLRELHIEPISGLAVKIVQAMGARDSVDKHEFFASVWGMKFSKERHKTTLSMGLRRFSEKYRIKMSSVQSEIRFPLGISIPASRT